MGSEATPPVWRAHTLLEVIVKESHHTDVKVKIGRPIHQVSHRCIK